MSPFSNIFSAAKQPATMHLTNLETSGKREYTEARAVQFHNGEPEWLLRKRGVGEALAGKAIDEQQRHERQRIGAAMPFDRRLPDRDKIIIVNPQRAIRHSSVNFSQRNPSTIALYPTKGARNSPKKM